MTITIEETNIVLLLQNIDKHLERIITVLRKIEEHTRT